MLLKMLDIETVNIGVKLRVENMFVSNLEHFCSVLSMEKNVISVLSNQVVMANPAVPKSPEDENNNDKFDPANDDDSSSSSSEHCGLDRTHYAIEDHEVTKHVMESCGTTKYAVEDSDTTKYAMVGHDTNSPTDTASNRDAILVENVVNLNCGSERNLKTEDEPSIDSSMVKQDRINSWKAVSAKDITSDAHGCLLAKRKSKEDKIKKSLVPDFEDKGKNIHIDNGDVDAYIKHIDSSYSGISKEQVKFFDAAIVYDKKDYEGALDLRNKLICIVKSNMIENPMIELFDSKEFDQSNMKIEDVINRCGLVLVYLTRNFTSPKLHLFIEELIGISRFGYNDSGIQSGRASKQRQLVLKPVHTQSRKYRDYKTPVGLLTVNGIDWFDRSSDHTRSHIIALFQTAITQRKQRDMEVNTSNIYKQTFGSLHDIPYLGPPFTNRCSHPSATDAPTHWPARQLISHPSEDAMSMFPVSSVNQQIPPEERPYRHIWNEYSDASVGVHGIGHHHMPQSTSFDSSIAYGISRDLTDKPECLSRTASAVFPGSPTMSPYGVPQQRHQHTNQEVSQPTRGQKFAQFPVQHIQHYHLAATQPGIVHQSAGLQTHRAHAEQRLRGYMNQQPPTMSPYGVPQQRHQHTNEEVSQPTRGQKFAQFPVQYIQHHHLAATQPGIVHQSAGLQTHRAHEEQRLLGYMNQQPQVMPTTHVRGVPMHTDIRNTHIPIYPPTIYDQQTGPYDAYQNELLSRDALPSATSSYRRDVMHDTTSSSRSATSSYLRDVMHDTTSSSRLSIVSKVSGKLIVNPNLSTDDVEVDSVSEPVITSINVTKKHMIGQVSHDYSSESDDYSSDSDLDLPAERKTSVKSRVVNIVGCKVVQIGKGNRVIEADSIPGDKMDVAHDKDKGMDVDKVDKKDVPHDRETDMDVEKLDKTDLSHDMEKHMDTVKFHSNRTWKISRSPQRIIPAEQERGKSRDSEMNNFSFSEDDMSWESSTSQNVNYQMTQKPTLEKTMKCSGNENNGQEYFEVQSIQPIRQTNDLSLNSEKQEDATILHKRQHKPMLNVSVNRISDCGDSSADDNESFSPDDNISDEQLFGSDSNGPYGSSENNPGASSDAPFAFNQATRHTGYFCLLIRCHLSNQTDSTNTSDECELD